LSDDPRERPTQPELPTRLTTDKVDVRRALVVDRLVRAWDKQPGMRLGQLIVEALEMASASDIAALALIDDVGLIERIERFVLLGS